MAACESIGNANYAVNNRFWLQEAKPWPTNDIYFTGVATDGVKVQFGEDALNGFNEEKFIVDNIRYEIVNNAHMFTFDQISDAVALRA